MRPTESHQVHEPTCLPPLRSPSDFFVCPSPGYHSVSTPSCTVAGGGPGLAGALAGRCAGGGANGFGAGFGPESPPQAEKESAAAHSQPYRRSLVFIPCMLAP